VTVGLGTNSSGAKAIVIANASGTVDVQVDVEGYYTGGEAGQGFVSVAPTRVCDTRANNPSSLSGAFAQCNGSNDHGSSIGAGATKTITVAGTGFPSWTGWTPSAAVVDITAINPTATTSLTAYRNSQGRPATTSLSAPAGAIVDKEVVVGLGSSSGAFVLYNAAGTANVTVDLLGYFYSAAGNGTPLYVPLQSQRICDSRSGNPSSLSSPYSQCNGSGNAGETIGAGGTLTMQVGGIDSVPQTPFSVTVNITALNETTAGSLVVYPSTAYRPNVTTLSYSAGQVSSNQDTVSTSGGFITIYNSSGSTDVTVDLVGYYVLPDPNNATFAYDGNGLRSSVTTTSTSAFTYDSTGTLPQVLEDGANAYLHGPSGEVFEQVSNGGTADYLVQDQIGSTRVLTDSSGEVAGTLNFDAVGSVLSRTGVVSTPIEFAGGYTDQSTGLVYLIHRYYDPVVSQLSSVDPMLASTNQPYEYANDNPVRSTDPLGLYPNCAAKVNDIHGSTHVGGTVNVVYQMRCSDWVYFVTMTVVLYKQGLFGWYQQNAGSGWTFEQSKFSVNTAMTCTSRASSVFMALGTSTITHQDGSKWYSSGADGARRLNCGTPGG
jgi:RHS repeat-associated protein